MKRKFRWMFEGKDKDGNSVFPACLVILDHRPAFPYKVVADESGGKEIPLPEEIRITQMFGMYEEQEQAKKEFDKFSDFPSVTDAVLTMLDGCGNPIEQWYFHDVKMQLNPLTDLSDPDGITAEWIVSYQSSKWEVKESSLLEVFDASGRVVLK